MFMSVFRVMIMSALHLMSMKSIQTGNQSSENMNLHLYLLLIHECIFWFPFPTILETRYIPELAISNVDK